MNGDKMWIAYLALLAAITINAVNFFLGNLVVQELSAWTLTFWSRVIALICILPFVLKARGNPIDYFRQYRLKAVSLAVFGVVLVPGLFYLAVRSDELINLSAGYTAVPLLTVLFSAVLLGERLRHIQYLGIALAFIGALIFAFRGNVADFIDFKPHVAFLLMIGCTAARGLYLVLLKKWDMQPGLDAGLFAILALGALILLPGFVVSELEAPRAFDYSWRVWISIMYIGVGMGAVYLYLLTYGAYKAGASTASLFAYLLPVFVAVGSIGLLGSSLQLYQLIGAVFVVGGVVIVTRMGRPPDQIHAPPH